MLHLSGGSTAAMGRSIPFLQEIDELLVAFTPDDRTHAML